MFELLCAMGVGCGRALGLRDARRGSGLSRVCLTALAYAKDGKLKALADALMQAQDAGEVKAQLVAQGIEPLEGDARQYLDHIRRELPRLLRIERNTTGA